MCISTNKQHDGSQSDLAILHENLISKKIWHYLAIILLCDWILEHTKIITSISQSGFG